MLQAASPITSQPIFSLLVRDRLAIKSYPLARLRGDPTLLVVQAETRAGIGQDFGMVVRSNVKHALCLIHGTADSILVLRRENG